MCLCKILFDPEPVSDRTEWMMRSSQCQTVTNSRGMCWSIAYISVAWPRSLSACGKHGAHWFVFIAKTCFMNQDRFNNIPHDCTLEVEQNSIVFFSILKELLAIWVACNKEYYFKLQVSWAGFEVEMKTTTQHTKTISKLKNRLFHMTHEIPYFCAIWLFSAHHFCTVVVCIL